MAEQATVRIHRPKQFNAMGLAMDIEVDGREVGADVLLEARYAGHLILRPELVQIGAGAPVQPPVAEGGAAPSATVRIHRHKHRTGASFVMVIEVDGREEVGQLRNGQDLVTHVEAGRRNVRVRQGTRSDLLELGLAPGADVRLEAIYKPGYLTLRPQLVQIGIGTPVPAEQVLGAAETHRSEEPIGTQDLLIYNRSDAARVTRTMRVTREWSRTVSLHLSDSRGGSTELRCGPAWLKFGKSVEERLSRDYEVEKYHRVEFVEEVSVQVEPGNTVTVVLAWKRIWQHGVVRTLFQEQQVDIPYQVAVGVTFDQALV